MWQSCGRTYLEAIASEIENTDIFDVAEEAVRNISSFMLNMGKVELDAEVTYHKNYFSETNVTVDGTPKEEVAYRQWSA